MLSKEQKEELERLKKDADVKAFKNSQEQRERQYLYRLRWMKKQGMKLKEVSCSED